jgi:hypothetical protein
VVAVRADGAVCADGGVAVRHAVAYGTVAVTVTVREGRQEWECAMSWSFKSRCGPTVMGF